jgi:hypothetical protein
MTRGDLKTDRAGSRTPFQIFADYYQTGVGFEHAVLVAAEAGGLAAVNALVTFAGIVIEPGRNAAC